MHVSPAQKLIGVIVTYIIMHCSENNLLKYFTANWKKGNRPVVN